MAILRALPHGYQVSHALAGKPLKARASRADGAPEEDVTVTAFAEPHLGVQGGYYNVVFPDGASGWVERVSAMGQVGGASGVRSIPLPGQPR